MDLLSRQLEALEPDLRACAEELGRILRKAAARQDQAEEQALQCSLTLSPLSLAPTDYAGAQEQLSQARRRVEEMVARVGALQRRAGEAAARASRALQTARGDLEQASRELSGLVQAAGKMEAVPGPS